MGPTKSKAGTRDIPMTDSVYDMLWIMNQVKFNLKKETPDEFKEVIFLNRKGLPTKNSAYDTHIYKICEKCGIKPFSMHTIRHTFATRCVESGMNFKTLQTILGHSKISMTMDRYAHVTADTLKLEIGKFAEYAADKKII